LTIAKRIASGQGGDGIHVGANRALLGVAVTATTAFGAAQSDGATVQSVQSGSAAAEAGIREGDVITGIDDTRIFSAQELTHKLIEYQPKDSVTVTWTDSSGTSREATVRLGSGPPA
jgi:S1-C subfamily serine protease